VGFAQQQQLDIHVCQALLQTESMPGRIFQPPDKQRYFFLTKTCPSRAKRRRHAL
jgi:hypothetical protein